MSLKSRPFSGFRFLWDAPGVLHRLWVLRAPKTKCEGRGTLKGHLQPQGRRLDYMHPTLSDDPKNGLVNGYWTPIDFDHLYIYIIYIRGRSVGIFFNIILLIIIQHPTWCRGIDAKIISNHDFKTSGFSHRKNHDRRVSKPLGIPMS